MLLRRAIPLALAIAAIACEPPVPFDASAHNPSFVDYAVFDPAPDPVDNSPVDIPLPSDVALQPQALATQSGAQLEVLQSFAAQGGWPADQDLALTFDFVRINLDATGKATRTAPALDLSTINPSTLLILSLSAASTAGFFSVSRVVVNGTPCSLKNFAMMCIVCRHPSQGVGSAARLFWWAVSAS